ncbi:hypothetical protein AB0395_12360 [Streptosporangium sp. NPDC051023]|uniref:hypothetical protein n=1 Tax=Streptosporangium sp. NPDC051023 TaxID=3155410 RepID=UPI00344B9F22
MYDLPVWVPLAVSVLNLATALVSWASVRTRRPGQTAGDRTADEPRAAEPRRVTGR